MIEPTDTSTPDYEQLFWKLVRRYMVHHYLLLLAAKYRRQVMGAALERRVRKHLHFTSSLSFSDTSVQEYAAISHEARLWHGTGRLEYNKVAVVDIFDAIAQNGVLTPNRDVYSIVLTGKEMVSLSVTPSRIIARSYADRHGKGILEKDRYGSSLWWAAYYYSLCYGEILLKHSHKMVRNLKAFDRASSDEQGERTWGKKVNSRSKSIWDTFGLGSDIVGNYPIIFGIKQTDKIATLPKSMQKWEVRIIEPVFFSNITHIEVPFQKLAEVQSLLARYGHTIPVFSIELGELWTSQQSLVKILH
jgi:hypothetical protein